MRERALPPVWLMSSLNLLQGANGAAMLIAVPQLLAAGGVPEPRITLVIAIALIPSFSGFLLAPVLDWRFSRRSYALLFAVLAALSQFMALLFIHDTAWLAVLLFLTYTAVMLYVAAIGGWLAGLTGAQDKNRLGAWLTVWNVGGGGIIALTAAPLLRQLPFTLGAAILSLSLLLPLPLFAWLPARPADGRLARESFRDFVRDVLSLLRRPSIRWTIALFILPAASFTLTNSLAGLGGDFGASERMVSILGGIGITIAGIVGSLMVPPALRSMSPPRLYLLIGGLGAVFTVTLILVPHTPMVFALAMVGENAFQSAAFSVENAIVLRGIGNDNPFAATQFALLNAASSVPIAYMQAIDGQAYGMAGLTGSFLSDASISLAACGLLALVVVRRI